MSAPSSISILAINQTAVIMDVNVFQHNQDDATLFEIIDEVQFFPYPHCNGQGYSSFNLLPMDTVVAKAQFYVKQGTELNPILLNKISASLVAVRQNDVEEVILEEEEINTSQFLPNCDNVQPIQFNRPRGWLYYVTDCSDEIQLFRVPTLDIAGKVAYELVYPFRVRWEEWRKYQGIAGQALRCFPEPTQNWVVYANQPGWSIKFAIKAEVQRQYPLTDCLAVNPVVTNFEHITWGTIKDPCEIPYAVEFNTYDVTGVNTYEEVVAKDADTFVEATITGDFSGFSESDLYGILMLDAWGVGGIDYMQQIGSRKPVDADGVWYGPGSSLMATLTKVSNNTLKLSAYINYLYLPTDTNQLILSATIGKFEQSASSSGGGCMNEIESTDFTCGELEIIEVLDANTLVVIGQVNTAEFRDVLVDSLVLTFVTSTTWTASGGTIAGNQVISGTVGGNIIKAPTHPYTDANVGDTIQGEVSGTLNSSTTPINGIGDMQIGCTFFVS